LKNIDIVMPEDTRLEGHDAVLILLKINLTCIFILSLRLAGL